MMRYQPSKSSLLLSLALLGLAACEDLPENPTWEGEVRGILEANCVRCHGQSMPNIPGLDPIPTGFRLDSYEDAVAQRSRILARAVDEATMPPDSYLTPHQKDILLLWIENGTPEGLP